MEEFVAYIVKNLVADPEAVEIRSIQDESGESIKLEIRVAPDDIGKIIGRRGNTIHALRTILRRVCARLKKKIQIDLIQP
ncbi:KH domain protein, partial [Chlamydia psittaci 84-8471/1]